MPQEEELRKTMPYSPEAEQSVIGAMISDNDAVTIAQEIVKAEDFYSRQYAVIFEAITELYEKNVAVDPITLQTKLREKNLPPEVYSTEMIAGLIAAVPTSVYIRDHAQIVADKALLRRLIRASEEIEADCYAQNKDMESILNEAEKKVYDLTQKGAANDYTPIKKIVVDAVEKIEQASRVSGNITGIPTGFTDLDNRTAGLQPSDFILIAARPSMGKTALALNIAEHVTFEEDKSVAIFSLEMSKESLMNRMFSMQSHIDAQKIRTGDLSDREWSDLMESAGRIGDSKLIIDSTPGISVPEIRSKCRRYKMDHGLDLVIIDYLQLMSGSARNDSRQQEISDISRSLKGLARELDVPVIALSQLSRAVEGRPNHRPMLSDLRESGAIEQDADLVMFIYREDYYKEDTDKRGVAEIIIAKQRNGPIGTVELAWVPNQTKFQNLARRPQYGE
ncbi:MAG: replicative DNA helicase [Lachnospiraceae bacterium]|nr:replicative DNA helicase [Lachnospiraceae bacterium]